MDVTYDYYRIFYYVAKYKSFTKAAAILMNNQPNISRSMNNLEKQLGCTLFIRSNRGITLTPEGKRLYSYVSVAYKQLQSAELELSNSSRLESGAVTISASETALHGILLDALKDFRKDYPGIHIHIFNHHTTQALQSVRNGLADFAVITTGPQVRKSFKEIRLKEYRERLICGPKYQFLANEKHHLADLKQYPYVSLSRNTVTHEYYTNFYLEHGLIFNPEIEVATSDQLIPVISHDLGIGFVPDILLDNYPNSNDIYEIPLHENIPSRNICLVEDINHPLSGAATKLKNMLTSLE